ncbi:hypothetical protein [Microbacterium gorillae]|uniref:hypothetical protein n=1 Tax=Microbacterium gorillae TaxID=1231063 RepID=UPI00058FBF6F|nr:hypothetical protein [Microbacterium gorillae]
MIGRIVAGVLALAGAVLIVVWVVMLSSHGWTGVAGRTGLVEVLVFSGGIVCLVVASVIPLVGSRRSQDPE